MDITATQVNNLGGYEVLLTFDGAVLSFLSASNSTFLGSTGRSVLCAPPVLEPLAGTQIRLHFGCGTIGATPSMGPSGAGTLATLTFAPLAPLVAQLNLEPSLVDPLGATINAVAFGGEVDISPGPTLTPTSTPSPTSTPTPCPGGLCPTPTPVPCSPTVIRIEPPALTGHPGVALDVPVSLRNVCNLGAFEFKLSFDSAVLEFVAFDVGPFLGSTGRAVACPPVEIGTASVTARCTTLGAPPPAGAGGNGIIATMRLVPSQAGSSTLSLSDVTLLDPAANPLSSTSENGSVEIVPCSSCPTVTQSPTATATLTTEPTPTPSATWTPTPCTGACSTPMIATATSTPASGPVTVRVDPNSYATLEGATFITSVRIDNVANLGAFSVALTWDPAILSLNAAMAGSFLGSTGRPSFCSLEGGGSLGTARFSCGSLGATPPGATGSGVLVDFLFHAVAPGNSALSLEGVSLLAPDAHSIPVSAHVDGTVIVSPCGGTCTTATPTSVGTPTSTPGSGGNAVIGASPHHVNVTVGAQFAVDVTVSNVTNLGAFEFVFQYAVAAPSFLSFSGVQVGTFLGSTGRAVICQPAIVDALTIRFACATSGAAIGPSGGGVLATLTFQATAAGTTDLFGPSAVDLADPLGDSIPVQLLAPGTASAFPPGVTPTSTNTPQAAASTAPGSAPNSPLSIAAGLLGTTNGVVAAGAFVFFGLVLLSPRFYSLAGNRTRLVAVAGCLMMLSLVQFPTGAASDSLPVTSSQPASTSLFVGGSPAVIQHAVTGLVANQEVSGLRVRYRFDPTLVEVTLNAGELLGRTGRSVSCATTIINHYEREYSCSTSGPEPSATGDGVLVDFVLATAPDLGHIRASRGNGGLAPFGVALDDVHVFDTAGQPLVLSTVLPPVVFLRALEGDINHDCRVDSADLLAVGSGFPFAFGSPHFDRDLDLVPPAGDDVIDIGDMQFVLGRLGSTCEAPIPPQTPAPVALAADVDGDAIPDALDNCPETSNSMQLDADGDLLGDQCEPLYGTNPGLADSDGDGCRDGQEARPATFAPSRGGDRNPSFDTGGQWDFFDVPLPVGPLVGVDGRMIVGSSSARNSVVTLADVSGVLANVGRTSANAEYAADHNHDGIADGRQFDRSPSLNALKPWRSGPPNDAITLTDVSIALAQVGHSCVG